jgi:ABC-type multidrug transport system permease subunit
MKKDLEEKEVSQNQLSNDNETKKTDLLLQTKQEQKGLIKKPKNVKLKNDKAHTSSIVTSVIGIKIVSTLAYLLFFIPLIFCRHEPYAIFHANQSLVLWLIVSAFYILFALISVHVFFLLIIIICHVLGIFFGMYNASHNRARHFWGAAKFCIFKP